MDRSTHTRLCSLAPLTELPAAHRAALVDAGSVLHLEPGQYLCRQGEACEEIYLLVAGEVEALANNLRVRQIRLADTGGDEELARGYPRPVSIRAIEASAVFCIPRAAFDEALRVARSRSESAQLAAEVARAPSSPRGNDAADSPDAPAGEDALRSTSWTSDLLRSELFKHIPAGNIHRIVSLMERVSVKAGDVIVRQGSSGDFYFFIRHGRAEVIRKTRPDAPHIRLAELSDGQSFGEEALVSDGQRNATVTMLTDGVLMRLSKKNFIELIRKPALNSVTYAQAQALINEGARWLDVRFPEEHDQSGIDQSLNLPVGSIRERAGELSANQRYVVYCDTGRDSSASAFLLTEMGFDACYLAGGLLHTLSNLRAEAAGLVHPASIEELADDVASFAAALEEDAEATAQGPNQGPNEGANESRALADKPPGHAPSDQAELPSPESAPNGALEAVRAELASVQTQLVAATRLRGVEEKARLAAEATMTEKLSEARMEQAAAEARAETARRAATDAEERALAAEKELEALITELSHSKLSAHTDADSHDKAMQHRLYEERQRAEAAELELAALSAGSGAETSADGTNSAELEDLKDALKAAHASRDQLETKLEQERAAWADAEKAGSEALASLNRQLQAVASERDAAQAESQKLTEVLTGSERRDAERQAERAMAAAERRQQLTRIDELNAALSRARSANEAELREATAALDAEREANRALETRLAEVARSSEQLARDNAALQQTLDEARSDPAEVPSELREALEAAQADVRSLNEQVSQLQAKRGNEREQLEQALLERDVILETERARFTTETARLDRLRDEAIEKLRRERRSMSIESKEVDQQLELALKLRSEAEAAMQAAVQLVKERGLETSGRPDAEIRIVPLSDDG